MPTPPDQPAAEARLRLLAAASVAATLAVIAFAVFQEPPAPTLADAASAAVPRPVSAAEASTAVAEAREAPAAKAGEPAPSTASAPDVRWVIAPVVPVEAPTPRAPSVASVGKRPAPPADFTVAGGRTTPGHAQREAALPPAEQGPPARDTKAPAQLSPSLRQRPRGQDFVFLQRAASAQPQPGDGPETPAKPEAASSAPSYTAPRTDGPVAEAPSEFGPTTLAEEKTDPPPLEPDAEPRKGPEEDAKPEGDGESFTFFNALLHRDMPAEVRTMEGFPRLRVVYGSEMWGPDQDESEPIERNFRRIAFQAQAQGLNLICLDIEHWNLDSNNHEAVMENVDKFLRILSWMRDESPGLKIGFYGLVPNMTPDDARFDHDDPRQVEERDRNDRLQVLTDAVDVLFPVMYTVVPPDQIGLWRRYVPAKIREARRIANGKPVYVFVWYEYHDALLPELAGVPVEASFWREQLDMIQADADGVVVWGGYRRNWHPDAEWWNELLGRIQPQKSMSFD